MSEQWIQQMRQKMAGYQRPAPEVSWDEIDHALAAGKSRKARLLWLWRVAAVAVFLLTAGVGYWFFLRNEAEQMRPTGASAADCTQPIGSQKEETLDIDLQSDQTPDSVILAVVHQSEGIAKLASKSEAVIPATATDHDTIHINGNVDGAFPRSNDDNGIHPSPPTTHHSPLTPNLHQQKHLDNRLTAKVYVSSPMAGRQTESFSIQGDKNTFDYPNLMQKSYHHRQPVRFGLSLRYRLSDRWSVESGLTYTCLSSDITTTVNGVTTVTEQRLNYIGLPLNISYDVWKSRHFGLYATAGSTIEKRLETCPWQFSLNGAAGAEYRLTDIFSLYAEPGLGYYFKDGSTTPTIYQDHPFSFNLSLGLRFNLK